MQSTVQMSNVRMLRRSGLGHASAGRRLKTEWPATVRAGDVTLPCTVMDISSPGANLRVENLPHGTAEILLVLDGFSPIPAALAWRSRQSAGLTFEKEQTWVLDKCRRRFDPAAWMRNSPMPTTH